MRFRRFAVAALALTAAAVGVMVAVSAVRAAGYQQYWRDQAGQPVAPNAFILVAFGDSATVGVGALDPANGFVGRTAVLITEVTGRPVHIINLAQGGATARDILERQLPQVDVARADLVIYCSSNDLEQNIPVSRYQRDLQEIIDRLPPTRTVVSDLPLMPGRDDYQRVLSSIADTAGTGRADFAATFNTTGHRLDIFSFLPPHLNDRGYGYWFDAFRPAVLDLIRRDE